MRNCFVQVRIEHFPFGLDWLQPIFREQIVQLFLDENHSGINRRLLALFFRSCEAKLEVVGNCYQSLK